MQMSSLHDVFIHEVQDLYDAEQQLIKALPKMSKAASHQSLKAAFNDHLSQTETHAERLEQIADELGFDVSGKKCKGMAGLIGEGEEIITSQDESLHRDLMLIAAAQKVEHYEIAGYGTARTLAEVMEHDNAADLLDQTAEEEGDTDQLLTQVAEDVMEDIATDEEE